MRLLNTFRKLPYPGPEPGVTLDGLLKKIEEVHKHNQVAIELQQFVMDVVLVVAMGFVVGLLIFKGVSHGNL